MNAMTCDVLANINYVIGDVDDVDDVDTVDDIDNVDAAVDVGNI